MWRGNLTDIGSQPVNVLGVIHNQLQAEITELNITTGNMTVKFTLYTTAEEQNPSFSRSVVFAYAQHNAFGFNNASLLTAAKTALNLP